MVAQQLAALPSPIREAIAQRETTVAKVRREDKAVEIRRVIRTISRINGLKC